MVEKQLYDSCSFSGKLSCVGQGDLKVNDSTTVACQQMKLNYNRNCHT